MCGDFEFCKERYEGVYCVLDRMSDDSKAQNIPQRKAKPIVKFIVPSPLEPAMRRRTPDRALITKKTSIQCELNRGY